MRVEFERSGGFAGIRLATGIDSDMLPPEEARTLAEEIDTARFFDLPEQVRGGGVGADQFQYKITIQHSGQRHTIEVGETGLTEELRPLVKHLERLARTNRR